MNADELTALIRLKNRKFWAKGTILGQIRSELRGLEAQKIRLTLAESSEVRAAHDVILVREPGKYRILVSDVFEHPAVFHLIKDKIAAYVNWLHASDASVEGFTGSASDGDKYTRAKFSFSSNVPDVVPLPDSHFLQQRGYAIFDEAAAQYGLPWRDRGSEIIWRGSVTGNGHFSVAPQFSNDPSVVQRLRFAAVAAANSIDFKFVVPRNDPQYHALANAGWLGAAANASNWATLKIAVDIDGYSNAWSNFLTRLKLGCCVLKVDSQFGYRQWYYDRIKPFEHFVPVRSDLSDLAEKVAWLRQHDKDAQEIASAGQEFARSMTFASETGIAAGLINENWNR